MPQLSQGALKNLFQTSWSGVNRIDKTTLFPCLVLVVGEGADGGDALGGGELTPLLFVGFFKFVFGEIGCRRDLVGMQGLERWEWG